MSPACATSVTFCATSVTFVTRQRAVGISTVHKELDKGSKKVKSEKIGQVPTSSKTLVWQTENPNFGLSQTGLWKICIRFRVLCCKDADGLSGKNCRQMGDIC